MEPTAAGIDGLLGPMSNLDIAAESHITPPHGALEAFFQSVEQSVLLAGKVQFHDAHVLSSRDTARLRSLHSHVDRLSEATRLIATAVDEIQDRAAHSTIKYLVGLEEQSSTIKKLLTHFDNEITHIARKAIENPRSGTEYLLPDIAEECYQATQLGGQLEAENYFVPILAAALGWPYDSDYESEQYYEHMDRLDCDENYAEVFANTCRARDEKRTREWQSWRQFWFRIMNKCPHGPTLFSEAVYKCDPMPRYLFRVFDCKSSGMNNEDMVASQASFCEADGNRTDLLSLDKVEATQMLFKHLTWANLDDDDARDNLTSWTSSLLYAVQYAIYRYNRNCHDVKICVVDTNEFPKGQFARDAELIREFMPSASEVPGASDFFNFRLTDKRYHNGEYLSQGLVRLTERSSIVSLERMKLLGLGDLYPELDDNRGKQKWANRVLELRGLWTAERQTTEKELKAARKIAGGCFSADISMEMQLMLLCFKNRKRLSKTKTSREHEPDYKMHNPVEVKRYMAATRVITPAEALQTFSVSA